MTSISIIPKPQEVIYNSGSFLFSSNSKIIVDTTSKSLAPLLKNFLKLFIKFEIKIEDKDNNQQKSNVIELILNSNLKELDTEGYNLNITQEKILITAFKLNGLFYGFQTLLLIISNQNKINSNNLEMEIPCLQIKDYPRFSWRGFMLDEGRHFFGKEIVKHLLDIMTLLKMNVFHWHLTEDQGWRIEIQKYPKLIEIGSKRKASHIGGIGSKKTNGIPHKGYYTQEDINEIVKYAEERFIQVVPEIEMPGHCMAALASYPELSCQGVPFEVPVMFGIKKDVYCAGKERVFKFLEDVLDEILELFPSKIIHIGGDEVPKKRWKICKDCQARIKNEGLKDEEDLQIYFVNRIAEYLANKGRRVMGWNENLADNLRMDAIGQYWFRNEKKVIEHLRKGRNFVMSKSWYVYLDYTYSLLPLKKCYNYNPIPKKLEQMYHSNVLGVEAPLWTEWVRDDRRLFRQVFPRLIAVAETGWTLNDNVNYQDFTSRLPSFLKKLTNLGIEYVPLEQTNPSFLKRKLGIITMLKEPQD